MAKQLSIFTTSDFGTKTNLGFKTLLYFTPLILLVLLLLIPPWYQELNYKLNLGQADRVIIGQEMNQASGKLFGGLPEAEYTVSPNRVIIPKIGVNAPIIEAETEEALNRGAWLLPDGATPDQGSNTIIAGHRYKYLPPSNLTFYLFHKLEIKDKVSIIWQEETYIYEIMEIKIVAPTEISILEPSQDSILTLFTCHPIYSTDQRLVVVAKLIAT